MISPDYGQQILSKTAQLRGTCQREVSGEVSPLSTALPCIATRLWRLKSVPARKGVTLSVRGPTLDVTLRRLYSRRILIL